MSATDEPQDNDLRPRYQQLVGRETATIKCLTPRSEPKMCDGWSEEIELDAPVRVEGDRIILPGYEPECPNCGNPSAFKVNGVELMFNV